MKAALPRALCPSSTGDRRRAGRELAPGVSGQRALLVIAAIAFGTSLPALLLVPARRRDQAAKRHGPREE